MADVGPVFERLCADLGRPVPSLDDALEIVAAAILRDIVDRTVSSETGLQHLMDDVYWPHVSQEEASESVGDSRDHPGPDRRVLELRRPT